MQIDGISSIPPVGSISSIQPSESSVVHASNAPIGSVALPAAHASTKPSSTSSGNGSSSRSSSRGGSSGGAHAGASATTSDASNLIAAIYTTTVDGKTYSGSVEESGGEYVASVAGLSGASASGNTVEAAELSLGVIIDAIA